MSARDGLYLFAMSGKVWEDGNRRAFARKLDAYRAESLAEAAPPCAVCETPIEWVTCPTGGWWAHHTHPADGHDALPPGVPSRADMLREAGGFADELIAAVSRTDPEAFAKVDALRAYSDRLHEIADGGTPARKDTGDGTQPLAGESTQPAPDLLARVHAALSGARGPLLPLPAATQQRLTDQVVKAIAPLVQYRPVWDSSLPPGGNVCSICGQPVESEPCPEHAATFFLPGRNYLRGRWTFHCLAVAPTPTSGLIWAVGFLVRTDGTCTACALDQGDWERGEWVESTTPSGDAS